MVAPGESPPATSRPASAGDPLGNGQEPLEPVATGPLRPPAGIPRRALWVGLAVFAVLGIGGALAERAIPLPGSTPTASPPSTTAAAPAVQRSLAGYDGLRRLTGAPAPAMALSAAGVARFSLGSLLGRPVMVTFLGATCGGICPVVTAELRAAQRDLARAGVHPSVVIVDADPRLLGAQGILATRSSGVLAGLGHASFLDGSMPQLERAWRSYGVTVELQPATGALAYTDVIYLIDDRGRLRDSVTPFANLAFSGSASLPAAQVQRFAAGLAAAAQALAR